MIKQSLKNGLIMRPSRPGDSPFLQSLYDEVRSDLDVLQDTPDFHRQILDFQFLAQTQGYGEQHPEAWYFIIEHLGTSIGKVTIDFSDDHIHLIDIAFISSYRGKGNGQVVIQAIQEIAAKLRVALTLSVFSQDQCLIQWYCRLGFTPQTQQSAHTVMCWLPQPLREVIHSSQTGGITHV